MDRLSLSQISDYNNREAFSRVRTTSRSKAANFMEAVSNAADFQKVRSGSIESSYSILNGISSRLDLIRANLGTMLGYAQDGLSATNSRDRDEAIGLLRSLSGGIDDIVENTVWKDQKLLDGRSIDLSLTGAGSGAREKLELGSYYTSDEDGMDLTEQPASGQGTIFYDYYSSYRNSNAGVVGLDISEAKASEVGSGFNELDTGYYKLEISYAGADSSVAIKTNDGTLLNTVNDVDLSGSGVETVDLEVGVSLTIEKEQILQSIDKYDFETNGPASLYGNLYFDQSYEHHLKLEDFDEFSDQSVSVTYQRNSTDSSGNDLEFDSIRATGVDSDQVGLAAGDYTIKVNYDGASSSVEVRGTDGKLAYLDYRLDLSGTDPVTVDTGKGLSFTINNEGYEGEAQISSLVSYQPEGNNNEDFDFSAYAKKIEDAIARLDADQLKVSEAMDRVYTMYQYQTGNYGLSGAVSTGAQVASLIGGSVDSSIFGATSANATLNATAEALFSGAASAISAQGEVTYAKNLA